MWLAVCVTHGYQAISDSRGSSVYTLDTGAKDMRHCMHSVDGDIVADLVPA